MNPYAPPSSEITSPSDSSQFVVALKRAILALLVSTTVFVILAFISKAIDWAIPGEGALNDATIIEILRKTTFVFTLLAMISFFSTFAHYAGKKRVNAGFCVIVIFLSGVFTAWILSRLGFESPRRLHMEHPPLYLSEFLAYIIPYAMTSGALIIFCNSRTLQNTRPNNSID